MRITLTEQETEMLKKGLEYLNAKTQTVEANRLIKSVLSKLNEEKSSNRISYLHGLSEKALELYDKYMEEYDVDLYHSIASVYDGLRNKGYEDVSSREVYEKYFNKLKTKRPLILEYTNSLHEFVEHVMKRLN